MQLCKIESSAKFVFCIRSFSLCTTPFCCMSGALFSPLYGMRALQPPVSHPSIKRLNGPDAMWICFSQCLQLFTIWYFYYFFFPVVPSLFLKTPFHFNGQTGNDNMSHLCMMSFDKLYITMKTFDSAYSFRQDVYVDWFFSLWWRNGRFFISV